MKIWPSMRRLIALFLAVFSLANCSFPTRIPTTVTAPDQAPQCAFTWASRSLPELSAQIEAAIKAARLTGVEITAVAFGENCIDAKTNQVDSFATMETDFHVTAKVSKLSNKNELGELLEKILIILDGYPVGKIPGPQPGYINVSFQAVDEQLNLMFLVTAGKSARTQGLHSAALLDELTRK